MVSWISMEVFNRILRSSPSTFTIFTQNGPVESGKAPMPHSSTTNLEQGVLLPGRLSTYGIGNGHLNYTGRLCGNPFNEGHGSIELIRGPEDAFATSSGNIINVPEFLSLDRSRTMSGGIPNSTYTLSVMGEVLYTYEASAAPIVEHIVVSVAGTVVTLIINGESHAVEIPEYLTFTSADNPSISPAGGKLWGVAIRPEPLDEDYCNEVYELVKDFPTVLKAEERFLPVSFVFDRRTLEAEYEYRLEDLDYEDSPKAEIMHNGMKLEDQDMTYIVSYLNMAYSENVHWAAIDSEHVEPVIVGDMSEDYDDHELYASTPMYAKDVVSFTDLNKETNGDPSQVYLFFPLQTNSITDPVLSMNMTFTDDTPSTYSTSQPDRTAMYSPSTNMFISPRGYSLLNGGVKGEVTIMADTLTTEGLDEYDPAQDDDPTVEIVTEATPPVAYGGWFYISSTSTGVLFQSSGMTVSIGADKSLVGVGTSSLYVDGVTASGPVAPGWRFIAAIPTTPAVVDTTVGNDTVLTHSFSEYASPNPSSYMNDLYLSYVDPPEVRATEPDQFEITHTGGRVYAHDWSISPAD